VLTEKPWRAAEVRFIIASILLAWFGGMALMLIAQQFGPSAERDRRFIRFLISTLSFQGVGLIFVSAFIKWHDLTWRDFFGVSGRSVGWIIFWALVMSVFAIPATVFLNGLVVWLISQFQQAPEPQPVMVVLQESTGVLERAALGTAAILIAPLFEESLFRGILYPAIKKAGYPALALAGTSLLFGAVHMSLPHFLPLTFFGIMLAVLYEKTDSLLAPVLAHALFNAVNFAYFIMSSGKPTLTG
jgi:membrane protease YdiL (CAAX protease family)